MSEEKKRKALIFIEHIEAHLEELFKPEAKAKVMCKICGKTIDEIFEEAED
ncbi:hypothetical protein ES707_10088 [subsurface metagenome]